MEDHNHSHNHNHKQRQNVINRLSRISGHAEAVKKMYVDGKDCEDILVQITAVKSALNNVGKIILQDHIDSCVTDAVEKGDKEALHKLNSAIDKFLRS